MIQRPRRTRPRTPRPPQGSTIINRRILPPRAPAGVVDRPRLTGIADLLTRYRLALVHAPAGSGKTTLLSQWFATLRRAGIAAVWYSVSDDEKDPLGLTDYLLLTLGEFLNTAAAPAFSADRTEASERLLGLIDTATSRGPLVLFIDDFHLTEAGDGSGTINALLAARFPQLVLVLASRTKPSLALGRYRANGEMIEISVDELQFTDGETKDFFRAARGVELSADESRHVWAHTEGWAAGLRLASLVLGRTGGSVMASAPAGGHRAYAEYFLEEVIAGLPEPVCEFLEDTSILETLGADLCNAVTGRDDAAALLDSLEMGQLFIVTLPGPQRWRKYHHLFQEFLQARLFARGPERVKALHARAARWFIGAGVPVDAVRHAFQSDQPKWAAELIEQYCLYDYLSHGRFDTYSRWMQQLPREAREERPLLMLLLVWQYINKRRFLQAEPTLAAIEDACADPSSPAALIARRTGLQVERRLHLMRALIGAYGGDFAACRRHIAALGARELDRLAFGQVDFDSIHGYLAYHEGDLATAERLTWKANGVYDEIACHWGGIHSRCIAAMSYLARGWLAEAEPVLQDAIAIGQVHFSEQSYMVALPSALLGVLAYESGHFARAEQLWRRAIPHEKTTDVSGLCERSLIPTIGLARLYDATGRIDEAATLLIRASRHASEAEDFRLEFQLAIERTDRAFRLGGVADGRREAERMRLQLDEARARFPPSAWQIWDGHEMAEARAIAAAGERGAAATRLLNAARRARSQARPPSAIVLEMLAVTIDRDAPSADRRDRLAALREEARKLGLRQSIRDVIEPDRRIAQARPVADDAVPAPTPIRPQALGSLTRRERAVLELMHAGLPNKDIARRLGININTVKSHAKNIFDKLNVGNRTQAVLKTIGR